MDTPTDPSDNPPDRLFYYADQNVVSGLWEEELKLSNPLDLNDPFEFLPQESRDPLVGSQWLKKQAAEYWHLLSLSSTPNNVRMWAQYGGRHTGIMLTLNLLSDPLASLKRQGQFVKVGYEEPESNFRVGVEFPMDKFLKRLAKTKGADWSHENEWRLLLNIQQCVSGPKPLLDNQFARFRMFNGRLTAFLRLPPQCIRKVTVGWLADKSLIYTLESIRREKRASWILAQAQPSHDRFAFEEEEVIADTN